MDYYLVHLALKKFMVKIDPILRCLLDHGILGYPLILPIPDKRLELSSLVRFLLASKHSRSMVQHRTVDIHLQTHYMYTSLQGNLANFPHQRAQVRSVRSSNQWSWFFFLLLHPRILWLRSRFLRKEREHLQYIDFLKFLGSNLTPLVLQFWIKPESTNLLS